MGMHTDIEEAIDTAKSMRFIDQVDLENSKNKVFKQTPRFLLFILIY